MVDILALGPKLQALHFPQHHRHRYNEFYNVHTMVPKSLIRRQMAYAAQKARLS